ncbi:hypothetical protein PHJA_001292300 [Phtheirospermum japonicum]|uniref:Uncharacterized protein n=1 Tax=Phtheirospermum japonicum TaxID=374723 RepID=A0A830C5W0_9LAMI|nr:hypothetical protein PHJA_001292300 [Phtheirospermum japonicum]
MSSQSEDGRSLDKGSENSDVVLMKPKLSYSREFLLSLTNLDSCKKLPSGFDESLRSEFEDALIRLPDRPRIPGSLSSQGFRRNDYSASPPTRGEAGNYSRGIHGKWDSRSSLRSDRDSDSQSDKDSDSGRRFGPQSRRSWQTPEHDGLLGSGSFPRPSGYAAGVSAPKPRANEPNQLNRSNEPYHPPRPYKAVPHSRRDTDSINDETFGSMECTSEDRAEAERKRRAAFEMMRKEQHKTLQEKQKSNPEKHKGGVFSDLGDVLGDSKEEKGLVGRNNEFEVSGGIPIPSNDLEKPFTSHSPASRPLVPPGFKTNTIEKGSGSKFLVPPPSSEVAKPVTGESLVDADAHLLPSTNGGLSDGQPGGKTHPSLLLEKRENANVFDSLDVPIKISGLEDQLFQVTRHSDSHVALGDPEIAKLNVGALEDKTASGSNRNYSTSILEKILGNTLPVDDRSSISAENHDIKSEDKWSLNSAQSSKFAQWFFEEVNVVPDPVCIYNKEEAIPAVLTCEDLEQSILSEYTAKPTNVPAIEKWSAISANSEKSSAHVDNHASLHLLSMLHKSTDQSNTIPCSAVDINLPDKPLLLSQENNNIAKMFEKPNGEENAKTLPDSGTSLTLETLFGSAFMNELQSVGAPVSVQRGPVGSTRVDSSDNFPIEEIFSKGVQFQLPEEENLISLGDARDRRMLNFMPAGNLINNVSLSSNTPINITEKLAAFAGKDERSMGSSESPNFPFDSYEKMGPAIYRDMQAQNSSPRFQHTPQMPQGRPLYNNHLEPPHPTARMGSQPKFVGPEPVFNHHDAHANHQMSPNMVRPPNFHHPNVRVSGFDIPPQHSMMHQMKMPGNHPSQFPRGFPVPHNGGNQASGFMQGMNQGQGFPFGPRQPNTASRGMPMPGNPPEAFQRLMETELRANSKQTRPLAPGHNNPEMMHGYEVDMGLRYR